MNTFSTGRLVLSDFAQLPGTTEWVPLVRFRASKRTAAASRPTKGTASQKRKRDQASNSAKRKVLWRRAIKNQGRISVGFPGFLLSIVIQIITHQIQSNWVLLEFPVPFRALFTGLFFGLACAVVTYFV